ncbi:hypothetical protein HK405_000903, partial [Cladochytrium tenue]
MEDRASQEAEVAELERLRALVPKIAPPSGSKKKLHGGKDKAFGPSSKGLSRAQSLPSSAHPQASAPPFRTILGGATAPRNSSQPLKAKPFVVSTAAQPLVQARAKPDLDPPQPLPQPPTPPPPRHAVNAAHKDPPAPVALAAASAPSPRGARLQKSPERKGTGSTRAIPAHANASSPRRPPTSPRIPVVVPTDMEQDQPSDGDTHGKVNTTIDVASSSSPAVLVHSPIGLLPRRDEPPENWEDELVDEAKEESIGQTDEHTQSAVGSGFDEAPVSDGGAKAHEDVASVGVFEHGEAERRDWEHVSERRSASESGTLDERRVESERAENDTEEQRDDEDDHAETELAVGGGRQLTPGSPPPEPRSPWLAAK